VLITTIRKETKRTEELEQAGYRSPTWAVLRALQQINSATIIEGEAAMSAPPFFQSAGRADLLFWGEKEGPTIVVWESLSEQEKKSWLEESSTMHDWVMSASPFFQSAGRGDLLFWGEKEGPTVVI